MDPLDPFESFHVADPSLKQRESEKEREKEREKEKNKSKKEKLCISDNQ